MLNQIYNTDCISFMRDMVENNKKVTHVITDIPYDVVNRESAGIRVFDKENADELSFNLPEFCSLINSVVEENVVIFCATEQLTLLSQRLEGFGFYTSIGIWEKSNPSPVNGQFMWLSGVECFIVASKNKPLTQKMKNIIARTISGKSKNHKTEKPISLLTQIIEHVSKKGDSIYDPCFGSASTLVAAKELNRDFVGTEIFEEYFQIGIKRLYE